MSRVGKTIIKIPAGVQVTYADSVVTVSKGNNTLSREIRTPIEVEIQNDEIKVTRGNDANLSRSLHGLYNRLIQNMIIGVTEGYTKHLILNGVGYKAQKQGNKLVLSLGYSHPVEMIDPEGLESVVEGNKIVVKGIDKEKVGQYAAEIRSKREPEPYKGKGIKYADEVIRRKVGKTGKK